MADRLRENGKVPAVGVQDGFTMIEILVVILIVGILGSYFGQSVFGQTNDAKIAVACQTIYQTIPEALSAYYLNHPITSKPSLDDLVERGVSRTNPWGHELEFYKNGRISSTGEPVTEKSLGLRYFTGPQRIYDYRPNIALSNAQKISAHCPNSVRHHSSGPSDLDTVQKIIDFISPGTSSVRVRYDLNAYN